MDEDARVPDAARLLRDFVNTREPQVDTESLATPAALQAWFAERNLVPADAALGPADLATAVAVREGLRAVLLGHAGHADEVDAARDLNRTLAGLPLTMAFDQDGYHLVGASGTPAGDAIGRLADAIRQSAEEGSWLRLKVCARDICRWAFYDASRNQVRRWCSMAGCGNHIKMQKAYAARKRRAQPAPSPVGD